MGNWRGFRLHLISLSTFLVATSTYTCLGVVCSEKERLALVMFKESVDDHSKMLSSWVGNECCRWERISCDSVSGKVKSIRLRGNTMSTHYDAGTGEQHDHFVRDDYHLIGNEVESSLAELRHLKYLDLSGNYFYGSRIPEFIGSFKHLNYLNLSNSGFQGIIPPHIGNLSNLKILDLNRNGGLMADDMSWTVGLSSLEHLDLSYSDLSGWDMELYMIPSLKELRLSSCRLSIAADIGLFHNSSRILPNIKHLDLRENVVKGPLPGFFQNMTSLAFLDLSDIDLSLAGNFPNLLKMIPSLSELHLSGCGLDKTHLSSPHLNYSSTLSNIRRLDLSRNSIEGIFPSFLTNMSSLRVLDLSQNLLNSSVPTMPSLLELDLSWNLFKQIEHLGIWRQCHLKQLRASQNDLEMIDSPKNISECSQYALEMLDLNSCGSGSTNLEPTIPESLGRLVNLRGIHLSAGGYPLTGSIPEFLGRLRFLQVLDLSYNRLTGPIPTFLGKLSKLDLSFNQLNGSIPESFGKLTALTELYLEFNQLTGPIPTSLGRLVSLQAFSVYSNMLNGTIPVSIGQLAKLDWLDISNNSLEGVVFEAHFANLSMLKHLDTSSNTKLTFDISSEWMPPFQLTTLLLSSCTIANGFPQWLRNHRELEMLVLFNATVTGPLPTWLRKMPIIPFLDLSHNKLCGPLTNLPNAGNVNVLGYGPKALFVEDNLFNESIPRSLCTRTDLEYLNLSRNKLTGKIPKCLENLQKLFTMRFGSNQLSGVIPSTLATNCSSLLRLNLNGNKLIGEIPREWGNLGDLQYFDAGDNQLSGNIPQGIGPSLIILRLHKNNFTGRIPQSLCEALHLRILDVASNNLTGTIPRCLGELTSMVDGGGLRVPPLSNDFDDNVNQLMKGVDLEYTTTLTMVYNLDLSSNNFLGEIPVELTALSMLVGLNLSNNHLIGNIPDSIGNMTNLFSLDLSGNQLTGAIPPNMAALNFLSHLNLSHNNLSGRIPTGSQLQTLTDPSIYAENKDLCGAPLPKNCPNHEDPTTAPKKKYQVADDHEPTQVWWFYLDIMGGFATGFWGVIGVLLFKKHWRHKLFMFAEETMDKIYDAVVVRVTKMKRGREAA